MLGYDVEFGHMEAVGLISSPKYAEKQVGYMVTSVLLNEVRSWAQPPPRQALPRVLTLGPHVCAAAPRVPAPRHQLHPQRHHQPQRHLPGARAGARIQRCGSPHVPGSPARAADRRCPASPARVQLAAKSLPSRWRPTCSACWSPAPCAPSFARRRRCACCACSGATRMCSTRRSGEQLRVPRFVVLALTVSRIAGPMRCLRFWMSATTACLPACCRSCRRWW